MAILSPENIWQLHLQGKSKEAFAAALEALASVDTKNFTAKDQAKNHFERARQVQVLGLSAAKKSLPWSEASNYLFGSLKTLRKNYPLAEDEREAAKRGEYWEGVSAEDSAQIIYLRDLLHLLQIVSEILPSQETTAFLAGINELLAKLSEEKPADRFGLIYLTERAAYGEAKQTYQDFLQKFGLESGKCQPNQLATVVARFMGRSVREQDFKQMKACLEVLLQIRETQINLRNFVIQELIINLLPLKDMTLKAKYQLWQTSAEKDSEMDFEVDSLLRSVFVGVGQGQVEKILK